MGLYEKALGIVSGLLVLTYDEDLVRWYVSSAPSGTGVTITNPVDEAGARNQAIASIQSHGWIQVSPWISFDPVNPDLGLRHTWSTVIVRPSTGVLIPE